MVRRQKSSLADNHRISVGARARATRRNACMHLPVRESRRCLRLTSMLCGHGRPSDEMRARADRG
eukprot:1169727-Pleurochrysis_carterae.AAC.4